MKKRSNLIKNLTSKYSYDDETSNSRNDYLKTLRENYLSVKSKKEREKLLDEAEKRTGLNRKYLMEKLKPKSNLDKIKTERKKRKQKYGNELKPALKSCWEIFDKPCGQRLKTLLKDEIERLRMLDELNCSDKTATKLKVIGSATIDRKLRHQKGVERMKRTEESDRVRDPVRFFTPQTISIEISILEPSKLKW